MSQRADLHRVYASNLCQIAGSIIGGLVGGRRADPECFEEFVMEDYQIEAAFDIAERILEENWKRAEWDAKAPA